MEYEWKIQDNKLIILEQEKEIGYALYEKDEEEDYIIQSIYVEEAYRGKGIAKIIFNELIELIKKENKKVTPVCSYAVKQFERTEALKELLK